MFTETKVENSNIEKLEKMGYTISGYRFQLLVVFEEEEGRSINKAIFFIIFKVTLSPQMDYFVLQNSIVVLLSNILLTHHYLVSFFMSLTNVLVVPTPSDSIFKTQVWFCIDQIVIQSYSTCIEKWVHTISYFILTNHRV